MYAIRARRKTVTEKDFLDAVNKASCQQTLAHSYMCMWLPFWLGTRHVRIQQASQSSAGGVGVCSCSCCLSRVLSSLQTTSASKLWSKQGARTLARSAAVR